MIYYSNNTLALNKVSGGTGLVIVSEKEDPEVLGQMPKSKNSCVCPGFRVADSGWVTDTPDEVVTFIEEIDTW